MDNIEQYTKLEDPDNYPVTYISSPPLQRLVELGNAIGLFIDGEISLVLADALRDILTFLEVMSYGEAEGEEPISCITDLDWLNRLKDLLYKTGEAYAEQYEHHT